MEHSRPTIAELNACLPSLERDVLALIAEPALTYAEVGAVLGLPPRSVATMAALGRLRLADGLSGTHLVDELEGDCWAAAADAAAELDDQAYDLAVAGSLAHRRACLRCRRALRAQRLAAAAYAGWVVCAPTAGLRRQTLERAARILAGERDGDDSPPPSGRIDTE